MKLRTPAMRMGLLPAGIAIALTPAFAGAQEQPANQNTTTLDRIEITGSRIRQASVETAQPVIALQRADIEKQGFTSVADIVQNLAATGSPAISRADALTSGEEVGGQYVDLRNLGPERTLVLLDGKRMGTSTGGYTDLASIPTSVVERIEVLTDGASAIYGSDAIAGVINIITRKNFDGLEASVYRGQYGQGDGDKETYNFVYGQTGERGSITFGAEYSKEKPVWAKDRRYSRYPNGQWHPTPTDEDANGWSAASNQGVLIDSADNWYVLNPGAAGTSLADFHEFGLPDYTNASKEMWLQSELERRSVFANGDLSLTDNIRATANVLYTKRTATSQIAGYPYQSEVYETPLSAESAFNPLKEDANFIRRTSEVPRQTESEQETFRFSAGLEGSFEFADKYWDWDVGYVYNQNKGVKTGTGDLFTPNVANAVGPSFIDADGVAHCGSEGKVIAGCTPWNPLLPYGATGPGALAGNEALQAYLFLPSHDTYTNTTKVWNANITGSLATLPAGELAVAAGYEHREESGEYNPDAMLQSGLSTSLAGAPTKGDYKLDEFYLELNVPILADVAFAKELSLDLAGRYSDYNTFGDTTNSKFGLKWKPIEDLLIRGTYATGFRAPNISNLYGGVSQTFDSYTDPCDSSFGAAVRNPSVAAACQAGGVPANFRQITSGGALSTGPGTQSYSAFESGSNPNLKPETSKTWTAGFVYSPSYVQGLDVSLDWWKIRIDDVIAAESVTSILNQCYVLGIDSACDRFSRGTSGRTTGQVVDVTRTLINGGYQETAGYDLGIRYRLPELSFGNFLIDWKTTYVDYLEYKRDNEAETPIEQSTGWGGNFRVRSNLNVDWSFGNFGVNWGVRYYSGMKEACSYDMDGGPECNMPDFVSPYTLAQPTRKVGSNTFHDLQIRYNAPWNATISLGANNVFDHEGPVMYSQPNSSFSYYGGFDIGRFVYMKYTQRF
ncbi:MAG: TonB-dependent receptor [Gammaproteobacteria bacterium]